MGFADAGFQVVYNALVKRDMELHEVDRNLQLLTGLGVEMLPEDRALHVGYGEREKGCQQRNHKRSPANTDKSCSPKEEFGKV